MSHGCASKGLDGQLKTMSENTGATRPTHERVSAIYVLWRRTSERERRVFRCWTMAELAWQVESG